MLILFLIHSNFRPDASMSGLAKNAPFYREPNGHPSPNTGSIKQGTHENFIQSAFRNFRQNSLPITADRFVSPAGKVFALSEPPRFTESLGKDLLILDVETRPLDGEGQILNDRPLDLDHATFDTMSRLDHYMYARTHGYDYMLVKALESDLKGSYTKVPAIQKLLPNYKFVVFLDGDTLFPYPHVPFEWLMNLWGITNNTLIAMPEDVNEAWSYDSRGGLILNSGFVVAQQSPRTHELLDAWATCPQETRYEGCAKYKDDWPKEQYTFSNWVRYDFNRSEEVVAIPCTHAMGYPGATHGGDICHGELMTHYTTAKGETSAAVQKSIMQYMMRELHRQFHEEYDKVVLNEARK
ncbi:Galactosyl transferase [Penicillium frequentans]|uniref:Galactosyl transferase n=1 Tax=Penicillium frequentans TaxID=3151616 RepID=A0AAD6GDE8_9EURO|nr:Galactosyl transferase [Penicillium glabrum]